MTNFKSLHACFTLSVTAFVPGSAAGLTMATLSKGASIFSMTASCSGVYLKNRSMSIWARARTASGRPDAPVPRGFSSRKLHPAAAKQAETRAVFRIAVGLMAFLTRRRRTIPIALAGFQKKRDLVLRQTVVTVLRDLPKQVIDAPIE